MSRIEKLLEYMKTSGKDSFLQHALALEYIKIGNDEEARKLFNEILLREPTYIGSYYHLGKLLERVGDYDVNGMNYCDWHQATTRSNHTTDHGGSRPCVSARSASPGSAQRTAAAGRCSPSSGTPL